MEDHKIQKPIIARIQQHFDLLIPRNLFLVSPDTKPGRVYNVYGSSSVKNNIKITFKITFDQDYTVDYLLDADGYTEHRRYSPASDQVEMLENFEGQFGNSEFEDEDIDYEEHRRIVKHNTEVRRMLVKKGFLRK